MRLNLSRTAVTDRIVLALTLAVACTLCLALDGFGQAAGAGANNPKILPGQPMKPSGTPPPQPPPITDPQVKAVLSQIEAAGALHPSSVAQWRHAYDVYATFAGPPENVFRVGNRTIPGPAGNISIRTYAPRAGGNFPVWVFFHGGGFVAGSLDTDDAPLRAVDNRCECLIVSVAYRLAPESPYPAATDDAYAAAKWVSEHASEIGGDPHRVAVGGDGAGGNLAAVVALIARDRGGPNLVCQLLIYPTLDASPVSPSRLLSHDPVFTTDALLVATGAYVPFNVNPESPLISPVQSTNLTKLPPAFIFTDNDDPMLDEAERYATELQNAGVPVRLFRYPNAIHGFFLMAGSLDVSKKLIDEVGATLKQALTAAE